MVFVELPKFNKKLSELETVTDKWLYFMSYASQMEEIPPTMKSEAAIEQAFQVVNWVNLSQEELDVLEQREFFIRDMHRLVEVAEQKAEKKGIEKVAQQLLDILDDETISQKTGLTLAEVQQLRQSQRTSDR